MSFSKRHKGNRTHWSASFTTKLYGTVTSKLILIRSEIWKTIPRYQNRGNWHRGIWTRILSTYNAKNTLTVHPLHLRHTTKRRTTKNEKNHPVSTTRVTGFEPVNNGTKIRCLSIWRYPYTRAAQIWVKIWLCHRSGAQFLAYATESRLNVALGTALGVPLYAKRLDRYCLNLIVKRVCLIRVDFFHMVHRLSIVASDV